MEISNAHHQAMAAHQLEQVLSGGCTKTDQQQRQQQQEQEKKLMRPQPDQALKCPRCESTNTKFCYYNNYSLSQPRYFCKGCRRYWTKGGSLRNVPVGGGCRKNKRSSSSSSSKIKHQDHPPQTLITTNLPPLPYHDPTHDLTLAFNNNAAPFLLGNPNPNPNPNSTSTGFLDILRSGFVDTSAQSGFQNLYYGFGGGEVQGGVLPFEGAFGGAITTTTTTTTTTTKAAVEELEGSSQGCCKALDGGDYGSNVGTVDSARDYWNGVGSYWHGLINSSLM